ncbi:MAG: nitroreductase [Planctomycetota bacterium]|jgi:nitroreductase
MTPDPIDFSDQLLSQLGTHASHRKFKPVELGDELVRRAVATAQTASTSSHIQAYSMLRIRDGATREELARLTGGQDQVSSAGAFFVVCGEARRHHLAAERAGAPLARNLESFLVAVIDAALFAEKLAIAFEAQGLGICYIGGLRTKLADVDALLELPHYVFPLFGLCVGVPQDLADMDPDKPVNKPRLPVDAVLFNDRYPTDAAMLELMDEHDAEMAGHYNERGRPGHNWTGGLVRRMAKPMREELAAYYLSKGAKLE